METKRETEERRDFWATLFVAPLVCHSPNNIHQLLWRSTTKTFAVGALVLLLVLAGGALAVSLAVAGQHLSIWPGEVGAEGY